MCCFLSGRGELTSPKHAPIPISELGPNRTLKKHSQEQRGTSTASSPRAWPSSRHRSSSSAPPLVRAAQARLPGYEALDASAAVRRRAAMTMGGSTYGMAARRRGARARWGAASSREADFFCLRYTSSLIICLLCIDFILRGEPPLTVYSVLHYSAHYGQSVS